MQDFDPQEYIMNAEFHFRRRRPPIFVANAFYLITVIALVLLSLLVSALYVFFSPDKQAISMIVNLVLYIPIMALPIILYTVRNPGVSLSMRLTPMTLPMALVAVAATFVCYFLSDTIGTLWMVLIQALGGKVMPTVSALPTTQGELMLAILLSGMLPGVCEELLFRGMILGAWERRGRTIGLVMSSVLFATMHGSVLYLPVHLMCGFVLGYLVIASDSLYVGMIFHTLYNSLSLFFSYLYAPSASYYEEIYKDLYLYVGGTPGILQLILQTLIFGAILFALLAAMNACRKRTPPDIVIPDRTPIDWRALILLIAGLVTVGAMYAVDLLSICGIVL